MKTQRSAIARGITFGRFAVQQLLAKQRMSSEIASASEKPFAFDAPSINLTASDPAWRATGDPRWYARARRAQGWFLGDNDLGLPIHDGATGGCRDGLLCDRVNENQGAESTLAYLLATVELHLTQNESGRLELKPATATKEEAARAAR